uniref:COX8A oxidase n=1 Tax=Otus sunia TaxID=257818 RepID=A0A8C8E7B8_9STRI
MSLAARLARSFLRSAVRPGPAQRGLSSGPPEQPLGPGVRAGKGRGGWGGDTRGDLGGEGGADPGADGAVPSQESVVGFVVMFVTCLGPAAWVLAHLEDYKKTE